MSYTAPELERSALVIIDTQSDFTLAGAPAEIPGTRELLPNMEKLLGMYRHAGRPIFHIVRLYKPTGANVDICRKEAVENGLALVQPGTDGAEPAPALKPDPMVRLDPDLLLGGGVQTWAPHEYVIYKPRWGAFFNTPLEERLRNYGVSTLVFCGCNFPNCPRTSIFQASERDFRVVVIRDALSGIYDRGVRELENIGIRVWDTDYFGQVFAPADAVSKE